MATIDEILYYLHYHPASSRAEIETGLSVTISAATVKRLLADAIKRNLIIVEGKSRASRYTITPQAHLLMPFDMDTYFRKEIDERTIQT